MSPTSQTAPLAGELVYVQGTLSTVTQGRGAATHGTRRGRFADVWDVRTSLVVQGTAESVALDPANQQLAVLASPHAPRVIDEDEWCRLLGRVGPPTLQKQYYPLRTVRSLYPRVRADHLRYLERWGLLRDVVRTPDETWYGFRDVAVIRQTHAELENGARASAACCARSRPRPTASCRSTSARRGARRNRRGCWRWSRASDAPAPTPSLFGTAAPVERTPAETTVPRGVVARQRRARRARAPRWLAYRAALELDPDLVPAMINLGNLHYLQDRLAEAQALYLQAASVDPECFEAWFNLGNVHHDRGRLEEASAVLRARRCACGRITPTRTSTWR